ncbi:MAG: hypothetical protein ABIE55_02470 [Candidatus Aenigmatarchaeota archaeon]
MATDEEIRKISGKIEKVKTGLVILCDTEGTISLETIGKLTSMELLGIISLLKDKKIEDFPIIIEKSL